MYSVDATDNCGSVTRRRVSGPASSSFMGVGSDIVMYSAHDLSGNNATCSFSIIVRDMEPPQITCASSMTLPTDVGVCGRVVTYTAATVSDNCPGPQSQLSSGANTVSGSSFSVGPTSVSFSANDTAGQVSSCSFMVTILDQELPTLICPADIVAGSDAGACNTQVSFGAVSSTDNCQQTQVSQILGGVNNSVFTVGSSLIRYRSLDTSGNAQTCNFTVTVRDVQLPTISCPASISVNALTGQCVAPVSFVAPVGLDNCVGSSTSLTAGLPSGSSFGV